MKKLLTLILGVVLFSGAAYAKIYWLPDYLQDNMDRSAGRVTEDTTNRTAGCSAGGYYNSPLGSGYNCSRVVYAHQACYSCTAKPCPSGYTAGLTKCAAKTGYSASYSSNGLSGTQTCGKCDYKELSCASGYSTSYQSVSNCGTTGSAGWTFTSNGYSGTKLCGKCTAKSCLSGYSTAYSDVSKCGSKGSKGWSWEKSSQYAGNSVCGKCSKLSCNSPYTSGITSCSPSDGYALKQDSGRYNGDTVCGYCQPNNCSGTKQSDCNTSNGYTFTQTCKSGTTIYGTCKANTCSGTKQSDCNTANGYTFTATCKSAGVNYGECYEPIYIPQPSGISDNATIRNTSLFDGRANTQAMLDQIGADALAATACNQFYAPGVDKNDANFGQGTWYFPAIGELMEMYGTTANDITCGTGMTGVNGDNKPAINDALTTLKDAGVDCATLKNGYYWSSSEISYSGSWRLNMDNGGRGGSGKNINHYVRCFRYLENKFNPKNAASAPKIGDVMYSDLTYGSVNNYNGSKTAVGIVTWVSEDGKSAKIVNLKDLRFSSINSTGNFNPDDPYNGIKAYTYNTTNAKYREDITGIDNYNDGRFAAAFQEAAK